MSIFENIIDSFFNALSDLWEKIKAVAKWIRVHLIRFKDNIAKFFHGTHHKYDLNRVKAVCVRVDDLLKDEKNYNTVNIGLMSAYYDTVTSTIIDDDIEIIAGDQIDQDIKDSFGDKSLVILQ